MHLRRIKIENFTSFKKTEVELAGDTLYVVRGLNHTDEGCDSNGAGKSSFYNAITWALFGRFPDLRSPDDVINEQKKHCSVELELDNGFMLTRTRTRGLSHSLSVRYDGKTEHELFSTATQAQEAVNRYFGLPSGTREAMDDFTTSVLMMIGEAKVAGGALTNTASVSTRMQAISRYLHLERLDAARDLAQESVRTLKSEIGGFDSALQTVKDLLKDGSSQIELKAAWKQATVERKELEIKARQLESTRARWRQLQTEMSRFEWVRDEVARQKCKLRELTQERKDAVGVLKERKARNRSAAKKAARVGSHEAFKWTVEELVEKVDQLSVDLDEAQTTHEKLIQEQGQLHKELDKVHSELREPQRCPKCEVALTALNGVIQELGEQTLQELKASLEKRIVKSEAVAKEVLEHSGKLAGKLDIATRRVERRKKLGERLRFAEDAQTSTQNKVVEAKREVDNLKTRGREVSESLDRVQAELKKLEARRPDEEIDLTDLNSKLSSADQEIDEVNARIGILRKQEGELLAQAKTRRDLVARKKKLNEQHAGTLKRLQTYEFWVNAFADIRRDMVAAFLPVLEERTNDLLTQVQAGLQIKIELVIEKKSSEGTKAAFEILIARERSWRRLSQFSMGERTRVGLALSLALKLLAQDNLHARFGWMMCDEVADTLDATGLRLLLDCLVTQPFQLFIISHRKVETLQLDEASKPVKELRVIKRKGISYLRVH